MARVSVAKTNLPYPNVDGVDVLVTTTPTDGTNQHEVAGAQAKDIVCVIKTDASVQQIYHFGYTNRYGRPSTPGLVDSQILTTLGYMAVFILDDLDGMLNPSGAFEFDVIASGHKAFVLRGGGDT